VWLCRGQPTLAIRRRVCAAFTRGIGIADPSFTVLSHSTLRRIIAYIECFDRSPQVRFCIFSKVGSWLWCKQPAPVSYRRFGGCGGGATARHSNEPISTATTESTVQWLLHRRMGANQQMRWSPRGAHLMLKVQTSVMNETFG
jgi:hypothetical protein